MRDLRLVPGQVQVPAVHWAGPAGRQEEGEEERGADLGDKVCLCGELSEEIKR